jgi:hypothetical protein
MDVALDANLILSDPRMEGNAFRGLLDYLKKTNSRLVLSKVVLDEVVARYPDRLQPVLHKATTAVRQLRNLVFDDKIQVPAIDVDHETGELRKKLLQPSKVLIGEVVRRGIERIPPANPEGEELRDVIHWLMILAHARTSARELAFITEDKHFKEGTALHPRLERDVQENRVELHFYPTLYDFIRAEAPPPKNLSEDDAFALYGRSQVGDRFEIEARRFFQNLWPAASSVQVIGRDARLRRGALYDVAPESQFGELEFSGEITVRVTELLFPNQYLSNVSSWSPSPVVSGISSPYMSGVGAVINLHAGNLIAPAFSGQSFPSNEGLTLSDLAGKGSPGLAFLSGPISTSPSVIEKVSEFHARGVIVISLRVVSGTVTNIETERFELGKFEKSG